jgi:type II secretory pathway pseudopilin PulG
VNLKSAKSNSGAGQAFESRTRAAFSLVEVLIVTTLLALIVLALMDVFSSTQRAFRASVTQVDVLEGSRAAMEMITADLRKMTAGGGSTNTLPLTAMPRDVNFSTVANGFNYASPTYTSANYAPLMQSLTGSPGSSRTNLLQYFFILGRENTKWTGTGYVVNANTNSPIYPLYRYHWEIGITNPPHMLFTNFLAKIRDGQWNDPKMSHLVDGVVHLVVRPYDLNGIWLTNGYTPAMTPPRDVLAFGSVQGEVNINFAGAAVPAAVELQMGVLEDRTIARAQSRGKPGTAPFGSPPEWSYLQGQSGTLHVFRQTVTIPNVDRSVYQ